MFLFPGQGSKKFEVKRSLNQISSSGRLMAESYETIGHVIGFLTNASPTEREQWKQKGHPITHKVVQPLPMAVDAQTVAGDFLCLEGRVFTIQGIRNPAELNHFNVYYCEERCDVQCLK